MRARDYAQSMPTDPDDGEVYRYGRPVEWGWTCFTCGTTGTGMLDQQCALKRLARHGASHSEGERDRLEAERGATEQQRRVERAQSALVIAERNLADLAARRDALLEGLAALSIGM
jgi:hypothetical protein